MECKPLSSFPLLTLDEFRSMCASFAKRINAYPGDLSTLGWTNIKHEEQDGTTILMISKIVDIPELVSIKNEKENAEENLDSEEVIEDDDPEMLVRLQPKTVEVEYNILLSPVYQVPVLHFFLRSSRFLGSDSLKPIYEYLVPEAYRSELEHVGVMGGISMTNHPASGLPVYFIHPCNTADALNDVAGPVPPSAEAYLPLWMGLVGHCIGLYIPKELSAYLSDHRDHNDSSTSSLVL